MSNFFLTSCRPGQKRLARHNPIIKFLWITIAEAARIEDRNHFEALVPRIYELGGKLPEKINDFNNISACPPASLPKDPKDTQAMLTVLVEAERCAVRGYTQICNMTAGKDHCTYDLLLAIK